MPKYICPMHPEVQQNEPGRCPKCGMKLVLEGSAHTTTHHHHAEPGESYFPLIVIIGLITLVTVIGMAAMALAMLLSR